MPTATVEAVVGVGSDTVAIDLEVVDEFDAAPGQFVLVRAPIGEDGESGYYTISSPTVEGTFEITVAVSPDDSPDESVGAWLAERAVGDAIEVDGPFGSVQYRGGHDVLVLAAGPGIGPAVGVAERAVHEGHGATVVYYGGEPPHADRLDALADDGVTVAITDDLADAESHLSDLDTESVYVFGFDRFVKEVRDLLESVGFDPSEAAIENFGPE